MSQRKERRVWVRFECTLRSTCRLAGEPSMDGWPAMVLNVSAGGICFRVPQDLEAGDLLLIEVLEHSHITLQARVVHVQDIGDGYYEVGCNFLRELDEEELKRLIL